ncbi:MAG: LytTR family transcriptional regulator [Oscillospiraceae bacterium]|nr:LytTR family transcriptional regulator [Oscillospiraceae bacterium]
MKIRLMVSEERYGAVYRELTEKGFEIDDSADLILVENNVYVKHLIGKQGEEMFRLDVKDITHIESFAHDVIAYTHGGEYRLNERLRRLEEILDPDDFIRVSNSAIVAASHIKSIRPALSQKFVLTLSDGSKVDVTRTYYYIFKEYLGI